MVDENSKDGPFDAGSPQAELFNEINNTLHGREVDTLLEVLPAFLPMICMSGYKKAEAHEVLALIGSCVRTIEYGAMLLGTDDIQDVNYIRLKACHHFLTAVAEKIMAEDVRGETETSVH